MALDREMYASLGPMLSPARFEVIPMHGVEEEAGFLPSGATVTVTASPRKGIDATITLSEHLASRGFRVVPHLMAHMVRSREHLREILDRLTLHQFDDVFVIGGDVTEPSVPYDSAVSLITDMSEMNNCPQHIGVAAYPEGHPLIDRNELFRALHAKQCRADYMVTQICFDAEIIRKWLSGMREGGIQLPVYLGIPGVLKRQKLLEISLRVGVGDSTRFLKNHMRLIATLLRRDLFSPNALVSKTVPLIMDPSHKIAGFHIYTFNQCQNTERWRKKTLRSLTHEAG